MNKKIFDQGFTKSVVEEMKKVIWPSKKQTIRLTAVVIIISLIIGLYIGIIDIFLAKGLELITKFR